MKMTLLLAIAFISGHAVAQGTPPPQPDPPAVQPPPICRECGVVESVREIVKQGEASGAGAVAGGVAGAVVGREVAGRRHRGTGTVLGAVGGAVAGHQIEKHVRSDRHYEIWVRFDDGGTRPVIQDTPPPWKAGDRVRLVNGVLSAY